MWFRNECPAHWGTFSYAHWWKGLSIAYEAPAPDGSLGGSRHAQQVRNQKPFVSPPLYVTIDRFAKTGSGQT